MSRHHVRPDGSVGRCDAKEGGRCKFAREGALHFESASEAQEYAAELLAYRSGGFMQGGAGSATERVGSGSLGDSGVTLIAERETRMSSDELDAHMDRLKRVRVACVSVWRFCHSVCARRPFLCAILAVVKEKHACAP